MATKKVDTAAGISDVLAKCLTSVTGNALRVHAQLQVDRMHMANKLGSSYVRHLRGTITTGA